MANIIASEILESGVNIPSLPASAPHLLKMAQKPSDKIDINALVRLIESDPALVAKILNLANSSYYRTAREIVGLRNAITHIGLSETVGSLYLYLFKNTLPTFPELKGFSDKEFWKASWACAVANRRLGDPRLQVETMPGELYIAGLLNGIGDLILAVYNPKEFNECIKLTRSTGQSLEEAELEIFGTTGSLVALKMLESWNLPPSICAAVGYCHSPESAEPEYREIAAVTQFACSIVNQSGIAKSYEGMDHSTITLLDMDFSDNYIVNNASYPFVDTMKQQKIVGEIISILENQSSTSQKSTSDKKGKEGQKNGIKKSVKKQATKPSSTVSKKKGFFSWIRTLFSD